MLTKENIKVLCDQYMQWYRDSIDEKLTDENSEASDYLRINSNCSDADIEKFRTLYREWIGFDMEYPHLVEPEVFIYDHL